MREEESIKSAVARTAILLFWHMASPKYMHIRERLNICPQGVQVYVRRTSGIRIHVEDSRAWAGFERA